MVVRLTCQLSYRQSYAFSIIILRADAAVHFWGITCLTLWPAQRGMTQCERKEFTAERGRINASWVPSTVKLMNFWEQVTSLCIQGVKHVIPKVREIHDMERQIKERQVKLMFDPRKYWTR
jgi:hypothetical protein